jgi:hypothetical protein
MADTTEAPFRALEERVTKLEHDLHQLQQTQFDAIGQAVDRNVASYWLTRTRGVVFGLVAVVGVSMIGFAASKGLSGFGQLGLALTWVQFWLLTVMMALGGVLTALPLYLWKRWSDF